MERCRDFRRASVSSVGEFLRRRQRITTLRDSTDENRQMQLPETVRSRDRERLLKKEMDREFPKRRRVDRSAVQPRSGGAGGGEGYGEMESTDWSDEEYHEEAEETKILHNKGMNQLSPTSYSLSNNKPGHRTLRSFPAIGFPADELFGVPVPRRARSVSAKRLRRCWISGMGGFGEDFSHGRFSPATMNLNRSGAGSPFSVGASSKTRMKSTEQGTRALSSASNSKPSIVQDDIEIEVAEALFDLLKQSQSQSQSSQIQEKVDSDSMETADCELKRLKAERREGENNTHSGQNEQSKEPSAATIAIVSTKDLRMENGVGKDKFLDDPASELVGGDGFVNKGTLGSLQESESPSCVKVDACDIQDPTVVTKAEHISAVVVAKQDAKLEIDLMASPAVVSSSARDTLVDREIHSNVTNGAVDKKSETISGDGAMGVAVRSQKENDVGVLGNASQLPEHDVDKYRNGFLSIGNSTIQQPQTQQEQKLQPTSLFTFPLGMSSWPGVLPDPQYMPSSQTALPINGSPRPSMTMLFKLSQPRPKRCATHSYIAHCIDAHLQLINKPVSSEPTDPVTPRGLKSLPTTKFAPGNLSLGGQNLGSGNDKPPPSQANNLLHYPGFMFPLGPANSSGALQSGTGSSAGKVNFRPPAAYGHHQIFPGNGVSPPYMTILNNGYPVSMPVPVPVPTSSSGMPSLRGVAPFFNSSLYQSSVFNQQQHPHASAAQSSSNKQQAAGDNKFRWWGSGAEARKLSVEGGGVWFGSNGIYHMKNFHLGQSRGEAT